MSNPTFSYDETINDISTWLLEYSDISFGYFDFELNINPFYRMIENWNNNNYFNTSYNPEPLFLYGLNNDVCLFYFNSYDNKYIIFCNSTNLYTSSISILIRVNDQDKFLNNLIKCGNKFEQLKITNNNT